MISFKMKDRLSCGVAALELVVDDDVLEELGGESIAASMKHI